MFNTPKYSAALGALLTCVSVAPMAFAGGSTSLTALPSHATPGQCYARVKHDAQYATKSEIIIVEEGYQHFEVEQAQLASRQENVLIKEASTRFEVRQPQYRNVTEKVMTSPAYDKLSVSAPQFKTVTERVQVSAPRVVWKRGNPGKLAAQGYNVLSTANGGYSNSGAGGAAYGSHSGYNSSHGTSYSSSSQNAQHCGDNCEIWCLVEEPGETMEYNRKVLASPGQVTRQPVPAKYTSINKQIVSDPGGVREIPVPAKYKSVTVQDVVSPGRAHEVSVPAVQGTIAKKVLTAPESYEWMRVICGTGRVVNSHTQHTPQTRTPHSSQSYGSGSYSQHSQSSSAYSQPSYSSGTGYVEGQYQSKIYGQPAEATQNRHSSSPNYSYYNNPPSSMNYSNSTHGTLSSSEPRIYGGEGMNSHHSAGH